MGGRNLSATLKFGRVCVHIFLVVINDMTVYM